MIQTVTTHLAVRDQPVYTAKDLKALYELRYLTRMKSLVVQKVGVTQSGSLFDTCICMCVGHFQSGFYEVIVLSSVRPLIGQHWRVPAVCWRAHNVTRNSSCPTAMQHGILRKPSAHHCVQNCPVVSCPVHTDPVPSLPHSVSPSDLRLCLVQCCLCCRYYATQITLQSNFKAITDECIVTVALCTH
jgi:hypothetical protein